MTDDTDADVIDVEPTDAEVIEQFERARSDARDPDRRRALEACQRAFQSGTISKKAAYSALLGAPNEEVEALFG